MANKVLAKKIKTARTESGLTQSDLAYRMSISAQLISAFESGRIEPSRLYVEKIAQFTHKPLYFFTGQKIAEALDRLDHLEKEVSEIRALLSTVSEADE